MTQRVGSNRIANNSITLEKLSNLVSPNLAFETASASFVAANAAFETANGASDLASAAFNTANAAFESANNVSSNEIINGTSNVTIASSGSTVDISVDGVINVASFTSSNSVYNSNINPIATNTYDLGTSSLRWRNIYTNDLNLNNGIGDWTIVEGEDDLFLYNNKKNKVYKFALVEVDASEATPKIDGLK